MVILGRPCYIDNKGQYGMVLLGDFLRYSLFHTVYRNVSVKGRSH